MVVASPVLLCPAAVVAGHEHHPRGPPTPTAWPLLLAVTEAHTIMVSHLYGFRDHCHHLDLWCGRKGRDRGGQDPWCSAQDVLEAAGTGSGPKKTHIAKSCDPWVRGGLCCRIVEGGTVIECVMSVQRRHSQCRSPTGSLCNLGQLT